MSRVWARRECTELFGVFGAKRTAPRREAWEDQRPYVPRLILEYTVPSTLQ